MWFSGEGKHSTDDAKKGQVFNAFFISAVAKTASDATTTIENKRLK